MRQRSRELAEAWSRSWTAYVAAMDAYLLNDALAALWEFVGEANQFVDREQPWTLAKQAKSGDAEAADRLRGVLGDLLEACRVISLAAAPFMPGAARACQRSSDSPSTTTRTAPADPRWKTQLPGGVRHWAEKLAMRKSCSHVSKTTLHDR